MKFFVDTADLKELEDCLRRGFASGVTTNPMIIARSNCGDFRTHINSMISLIRKYDAELPLSVEVFTPNPDEMVEQAEEFLQYFGHYKHINIKVPIGWDELAVIAELARRNIPVNCTCCMSYNQAVMAARAGAKYVSIFWGRIRDIGYDAGHVVKQVHETLTEWGSPSEIIVGSIRHIADVNEALQAGADILTVPPKFFPQMCVHPKTDEAVRQFVTEFQNWQKQTSGVGLARSA